MCRGVVSVWDRDYTEGMSAETEVGSRGKSCVQHLSPYHLCFQIIGVYRFP